MDRHVADRAQLARSQVAYDAHFADCEKHSKISVVVKGAYDGNGRSGKHITGILLLRDVSSDAHSCRKNTCHISRYGIPRIVVVENQAKALQMYKRVAVCASVVDASCDAGGRAV